MTYTLVLLRHGESDWNAKNLFTGWVDVDLTDKGRAEALRGGEQLREAGILPDVVHTSVQRRAINTANLSLDAADRHWIPVRRSWRLNERHYGALQGKDKKQTLAEYGEEQFMLWRRSFDVPPPPIADDDEFSQAGDPRYADLGDRDAPHRVSQGRHRADAAPLGVRSSRPGERQDGPHRRPWQQPPGHRQASRPDQRRGHRRVEHPDRHAAGLPTRRRAAARPSGAASTSTPRPQPKRPRPWRTRVADVTRATDLRSIKPKSRVSWCVWAGVRR